MKEEKMSVREYLLFVVRKKILSIVMVIVIFLLGFFGLKIYSDSRAYYQGSFMLYWDGIDANAYLNGSRFNYKNMISLSRLNEVVSDDPDSFSSINVEKMYNRDGIRIYYTRMYYDENNNDLGNTAYYTIATDASYYSSISQARSFVESLIEKELDVSRTMAKEREMVNSLDWISSTSEYEEVFNAVELQMTRLEEAISALIGSKSENYVYDSKDQKTLGSLQDEIDYMAYFYWNQDLKNQYISSRFVRNVDSYREKFQASLNTLNLNIQEKELFVSKLEEKMSGLQGSYTTDAYIEQIAPVLEEISALETRKSYIEACLANPVFDATYNAKTEETMNVLNTMTDTLEKVTRQIYEEDIDAVYGRSSVLYGVKPYSTLKTLLIALIASLVITLAFDFCYYALLTPEKRKRILLPKARKSPENDLPKEEEK